MVNHSDAGPQSGRWLPVWLGLGVVLLLALAWLPTAQLTPLERQIKPDLVVVERLPESLSSEQRKLLTALAQDIDSRLAPRHEFQLRPPALVPLGHEHFRLELEFELLSLRPEPLIRIQAKLATPTGQQHQWQVEGTTEVSALLAEQVVSTLLSHVKKATTEPTSG